MAFTTLSRSLHPFRGTGAISKVERSVFGRNGYSLPHSAVGSNPNLRKTIFPTEIISDAVWLYCGFRRKPATWSERSRKP